VTESDTHYKDLTDLSLAIIPSCTKQLSKNIIGKINTETYKDDSGLIESESDHHFLNEYYNTKNIYYNVGYWNEEFYRLGIVYIYENDSLSSVYNLVGGELNNSSDNLYTFSLKNYNYKGTIPSICSGDRVLLSDTDGVTFTDDGNYFTTENGIFNTRGVIHINDPEGTGEFENETYLYNLNVEIPENVVSYLKILKIKGFFIVR
jgi:hypothetical protein